MKRHLTLTSLSLALTLGISAVAATAPGSSLDSKPRLNGSVQTDSARWAFGDLAGTDGEGSMELAELDSLLYRAQSKKQLEEHAAKRVQIVVRKSMKDRGYQYLTVYVDGSPQYDAPVSTAWERLAPGKTGSYQAVTPPGSFMPDGMQLKRYSNRWQVWLKHVIRFNSGIWIHATTPDHFLELGAPASGGCVRLHPNDAQQVYEIVEKFGMKDTAITVLQQDGDEKQLPWKLQRSLKAPEALVSWRLANKVK